MTKKQKQDELRKIVATHWPGAGVFYGGKPYYAVSVEWCEFQVWHTPEGYAVRVFDCGTRVYAASLSGVPEAMILVGRRTRPEIAERLGWIDARNEPGNLALLDARSQLADFLKRLDHALSVMAPA